MPAAAPSTLIDCGCQVRPSPGIGTATAGIAAVTLIPFYNVFPTVGVLFDIKGFIIVVLGGLGSIPGSFVGGFILGVIGTAVTYWDAGLVVASYYVIFIILLLVRPKGLFGK